jgi:O-6-methylguanine DNA methyltransferase
MKKLMPFARKVYRVVARIPLGETRTYKWVAEQAGNPRACRAVGQILKRNPYPLIIPCHRVVANSGIGGYVFGVSRKKKLLAREREIKEWLESKR